MPRQVFSIKEFKYGIITASDTEDFNEEAASYSLNIDGSDIYGILRSIPTDADYKASDSVISNIRIAEMINIGDVYHLIYHDSNANEICLITDFYNKENFAKKITLFTVASDEVSLTNNKKQIIVGTTGNSKTITYAEAGIFGFGITHNITGCVNAGDGSIQVNISGTGAFAYKSGDIVKITGVTGTTEANGYWKVYNVFHDGTNGYITLSNSTYTNAYISGGVITQIFHINNSAIAPLVADTADNFYLSTISGGGSTGYFPANTYYEYRISLIYNGIEESPMSAYPTLNSFSITTGTAFEYIRLDLRMLGGYPTASNFDGTNLDRRVTGINIYRADSTDNSPSNIGLFRKIISIDINDSAWQPSASTQYYYIRDYGTYCVVSTSGGSSFTTSKLAYSENVTFQENSGLPETLYSTTRQWRLSTHGYGYHFVTNNDSVIYASQPYRYNSFNWVDNYVVVPKKITALAFFEGKLWAFSDNNVYRIHPVNLYIEDIYENVGALGQRSVHITEAGMFFANKNGAWRISGGQITDLSYAIQKKYVSTYKSWQSFAYNSINDIIVTSEPIKKYILFINEVDNSGVYQLFAWAYNYELKRWDAWDFGYNSSANSGQFKGKNGEIYLSYGTATKQLFAGNSYRNWEWTSKRIGLENSLQKKSFIKIKAGISGTVNMYYGIDTDTPSTPYTNEDNILQYGKSIMIKLSASSGNNFVKGLELIYREMEGKR